MRMCTPQKHASATGTGHWQWAHDLQRDVEAQEDVIAKLKAQQDDKTQDRMAKLTKAADGLGLKLAQQQGTLSNCQEDLQVRHLTAQRQTKTIDRCIRALLQ